MTESSLGRVLAVLRARWTLVVLLAVPVLLVSAWYAASREPAYRSESVLTFAPTEGAAPNSSFLRLVQRYVVAATGPAVLRDAEDRAGLPEGALRDAVSAQNPPSTLQLSITVTATAPEAAEAAADAIADELVRLAEADDLVRGEVIAGPAEARDATPARQAVALMAGVLLALLSGIALALGVEGARPRVRVREDLGALGIPVLASPRARSLASPGPGGGALADGTGIAGPRAWLAGEEATVVTAPADTDAEAAAVAAVTRVLGRTEDRPVPVAAGPSPATGRPARPVLSARPGLLTDDAAAADVVATGRCLLVVRAGTPLDVVGDCVDLLDRRGVELVGAVLVR